MSDQQEPEIDDEGTLTGILIPAGFTIEPQTVTQNYSCLVTFMVTSVVAVNDSDSAEAGIAAADSVDFDQVDADPNSVNAKAAGGPATQPRDVDTHDPNHPRHHHGTASKADDRKTIRYRGLVIDTDTAPGQFFVVVTVNGTSLKASAFYQPDTNIPPPSQA